MPRVALTDQQRRDNAKADISKAVLDELNAKRGRERKTKEEFSDLLGIAPSTWWKWNKTELACASWNDVLDAVLRAGLKIKVVFE